jgi:hypothetical protein
MSLCPNQGLVAHNIQHLCNITNYTELTQVKYGDWMCLKAVHNADLLNVLSRFIIHIDIVNIISIKESNAYIYTWACTEKCDKTFNT